MIWSTDEIPTQWAVQPLSALTLKVGSGATPRGGAATYIKTGIPLIRSQNVRFEGFSHHGLAFLSESQAHQLDNAIVESGDVLLNITGASIGRVSIAPEEMSGARVNQHVCIIRPKGRVLPAFLAAYLAAPQIQDSIAIGNYGVTREALTKSQILEVPVPVPDIPEQEVIVSHLDSIGSKRLSALAHIELARQAIRRFRRAVLSAACSGRLTSDWREENGQQPALHLAMEARKRPRQFSSIHNYNLDELPDGWSWAQVDDLLPKGGIFDGPFGSNLKTSDYTDAGARVVRLENIGHLRFIGEKRTYVSLEKYRQLLKHEVGPGDIMFSSFVDDEMRVCVLPSDVGTPTIAKADCFTLRPLDTVDRDYLALQLASPATFRALSNDVHGATRPRVNTTQVRSAPVPLCSFEEQREVVRRYRSAVGIINALERCLVAAEGRLRLSSQAVLAKAFKGELFVAGAEQEAAEVTP